MEKNIDFDENEQNGIKFQVKELLQADGKWESEQKITEEINKKHGTTYAQSTIHRALKKINAKKSGGVWTLEPEMEHQRNLSELKKFMSEAIDDNTELVKNPAIYLLKTRPSYNTLLAKKIRNVFKSDIRNIVCPNARDLIIFYGGEKCGNNNKANDFEKIIIEILGAD